MRFWLGLLVLGLAGCAENPADLKPTATVLEGSSTPAGALEGATLWEFSAENSQIEWVGSKMTGSHTGGFKKFGGEIKMVKGDPLLSSVRVQIETESIDSDDPDLTDHLKTHDFFEVDKYPQAVFESEEILRKKGDEYLLSGRLTLHGTTRRIRFPAVIQVTPDKVTARAEFSLNRFDFGLVYKGKADNLIRKEVLLKLNLNASARH